MDRARGFKKLDKLYPLTKFRAYLRGRLSPATCIPYVSAIRQMLGAVGENDTRRWKDLPLVRTHAETIGEGVELSLRRAWPHWLAFTGEVKLGSYWDARESGLRELGTAVRLIHNKLKTTSSSCTHIDLKDLRELSWVWREEEWKLALPGNAPRTIVSPVVMLWPALDHVRAWGYGTKDPKAAHAKWFLPSKLGQIDQMPPANFNYMLRLPLDEQFWMEIKQKGFDLSSAEWEKSKAKKG